MPLAKDMRRAYAVWREMGWTVVRQKIGRRLFPEGQWAGYMHEALIFASWMDFSPEDVARSQAVQAANAGPLEVKSLMWFLPEFTHAYYGGIYTLLRFADYFARQKGVQNHFAILGNSEPAVMAERISTAWPSLSGSPVSRFDLYQHMQDLPPTDAAISTLWGTAYFALRYNQTRRKFYFMQDYEPLFYPAGSTYAQVEATYRFGYQGIANTPSILSSYEQYGGQGEYFVPCVDTHIFHPPAEPRNNPDGPWTIFFYARPGHPRNGFELGAQALRLLKKRLGSKLRVVAAGDGWHPSDYGLENIVESLGLLKYTETADLYRTCDAGLVMMFTRHPSYLPFELMASGSLVVTNFNPTTTWFLKDRQNCRLSQISATCFAEVLEDALTNPTERQRITDFAAQQIRSEHSQWEREMEKVWGYMTGPVRTLPGVG